MLFTSYVFFLFLPVVLLLYWSMAKYRKAQNIILLIASYIFYGWWDWRFCFLLFFSSTFGYVMAWLINREEKDKRRGLLMAISAVVHLGLLSYYKYFNFFVSSIVDFANLTGRHIEYTPYNIILPLAISFFTFHILGYTFDVYRRAYKPAKDYIDFITHIAFFPQLVAGPIERAGHLLPQFEEKRSITVSKAEDGFSQMLWGFFKKVIIADSLALNVNYIFANYDHLSGSTVALGVVMFTIQMYCDFSGYSDIALGCARLMGFELLQNFNYPFFSQSMSEFWRKWHISLSSWINDYIFTPVSFLKREWGLWGVFYAAVVSFTLSGLWHGANWTFILWGTVNGLAIGYEILTRKARKKWSKKYNTVAYSILSTFLVLLFWAFANMIFRAKNIAHFWGLASTVFSRTLFTLPDNIGNKYLLWALALFVVEWFQRNRPYGLAIADKPYYIRWTAYAVLLVLIFSSDNLNNQNQFLYFQF